MISLGRGMVFPQSSYGMPWRDPCDDEPDMWERHADDCECRRCRPLAFALREKQEPPR